MDYLVSVIVEADNEENANSEANRIMNELVEWHDFDWYQTTVESSQSDNCWSPCKLDSSKAQAMVARAMQKQRELFDETISTVRTMINLYTDDEIFNEMFIKTEGLRLSRHQFTKAGGYHGNMSRLYDNYGDVILNQRQLDMYLREPDGLWVVQVDAHN